VHISSVFIYTTIATIYGEYTLFTKTMMYCNVPPSEIIKCTQEITKYIKIPPA